MPTTRYTQERGGEIRSPLPIGFAAAGAAVGAFIAGGFVLIITIGFGAVVGAFVGLCVVAVMRKIRGEDLGSSGDEGVGVDVPSGDTPEEAQRGEAGFASPSSSRS